MSPRTTAVLLGILLSAAALPLGAAPPARAADVNVTLIAFNFAFHVGSQTSNVTTIAVNVGDTLRLRVENHDTMQHTFTAPKFGVNDNLTAMGTATSVAFWNHTVTSADVGNWQYYCFFHASGSYPNLTGMVGVLSFAEPTTSAGLGISPAIIGGAVVIILIVVVAVVLLMRRKKPAPPTQPPQ